ncbi:hypothetical protein [Aquibacillus saliphilus]|nr:hypothetical protein [Aquibacillus saliphilus]
MNQKNKNEYKKSYESDGIMGKDKNDIKHTKKEIKEDDKALYFNITESSE